MALAKVRHGLPTHPELIEGEESRNSNPSNNALRKNYDGIEDADKAEQPVDAASLQRNEVPLGIAATPFQNQEIQLGVATVVGGNVHTDDESLKSDEVSLGVALLESMGLRHAALLLDKSTCLESELPGGKGMRPKSELLGDEDSHCESATSGEMDIHRESTLLYEKDFDCESLTGEIKDAHPTSGMVRDKDTCRESDICEEKDEQLSPTTSDTNSASSGRMEAAILEDKSRPAHSAAGEQLREGKALAQASSVKALQPRRFHEGRRLRVRDLSKADEPLRPQNPPDGQPTTEARGQREVRQSSEEARPAKKRRAEVFEHVWFKGQGKVLLEPEDSAA